jgi:CubicO group peptidase (beta-lactamase class C family)
VLLARATGRPCSELLAERITGPLRMRATGATAYIDPRRRLAAVLLTQRMMETSRPPAFMQRFWEAVYQGV